MHGMHVGGHCLREMGACEPDTILSVPVYGVYRVELEACTKLLRWQGKMGAVVTKKTSTASGSFSESLNQPRGSASAAGVRAVNEQGGDDVDPTTNLRTSLSSTTRETNSPSPLTPSPSPTEPEDTARLSRSSLGSGARETAARRGLVARCLNTLESGFGVNFERAQLLASVQEISCEPRQILLAAQQSAIGVYIVEEGGLEVLSPGEDAVVLCRLQPGDFCGELSSFFNIPCTATVRAQPGVR